MAALGQQARQLEAGRPRAGDEHPLGRLGPRQRRLALAPGTRVHRAAETHSLHDDPVQTVVRADTGPDLRGPAVTGLRDEVTVGEHGPGHTDDIGMPLVDDAGCRGGRRDPAGVDDREVERLLEPAREVRPLGDGVVVRLDVAGRAPVVSDHAVQVVDGPAGLQRGRDGQPLVQVVAALEQLVHVQPYPDGEVRADLLADPAQHVEEQAHAAGVVPAVLVLAVVGGGGEEQLEQILVVGVQLDTVKAGGLDLTGGEGVLLDEQGDLVGRQHVRDLVVGVVGQQARRRVRHPALHDQLCRRVRTGGVDRLGVPRGPLPEQRQPEDAAHGRAEPGRLEAGDGHVADESVDAADPGGTALGALTPVGDVGLRLPFATEEVTGQAAVRRQHDPIAQLHGADANRLEQEAALDLVRHVVSPSSSLRAGRRGRRIPWPGRASLRLRHRPSRWRRPWRCPRRTVPRPECRRP